MKLPYRTTSEIITRHCEAYKHAQQDSVRHENSDRTTPGTQRDRMKHENVPKDIVGPEQAQQGSVRHENVARDGEIRPGCTVRGGGQKGVVGKWYEP